MNGDYSFHARGYPGAKVDKIGTAFACHLIQDHSTSKVLDRIQRGTAYVGRSQNLILWADSESLQGPINSVSSPKEPDPKDPRLFGDVTETPGLESKKAER
jgi:hypothetical protein